MMGKLPLGVVSPYVKMSSGGSTDPMKFYATSYCTAYGREDFKPRVSAEHGATGYKSNYRPLVSYKPSLDTLDNPAMGEQLRDSFHSVSNQSYRPLEVPNGTQPLPWSLHQTSSSYARDAANMLPHSKEVRKVHFDTQDHGPQAITGLEPKSLPVLHQQQGKGSLEWENSHHGPRFMTSEYNSKYLREPSNQQDLLQKKSIGSKEESGFTEGSTKNPIIFQSPSQTMPGDSVALPSRTVTKSDFVPMTHPRGDEFLPVLARGSERDTGFSRINERILNPRVPTQSPELSSGPHQPFQPQQQANMSLLGRETLGNKEPTGFSLNNTGYVRSNYNTDGHYLTTYNQGYFENIPKGLDREGWTRGGIQPQQPSGYTLNHPVTRTEPMPSPEENMRRLHPHVGRTLMAAEPYYRAPPHPPPHPQTHPQPHPQPYPHGGCFPGSK